MQLSKSYRLTEQGEKKESVVDESEITEVASKLLRIGGKWYKKAKDPVTHQEALFDISPKMVIDDEGKDIGNLILKAAPKYLAKTNIPSHIDYHECIDNGDGEMFYNIYRPIPHVPAEGNWHHIEMLLRHIFQEQYEMGLDYIQILYGHPMHPLPILLLVSQRTGTGKSTFCNFLRSVFGENSLPLTPEIVESRFNSYWVGKLLGYIEEQAEDSKERKRQNAKTKNIVTAEKLPMEAKGKDPTLTQNFLKVIICSNDEETPVKIEANDTRYWVRQVPPLSSEEESKDILAECRKEIPFFLFFLQRRQLFHDRKNRLWFSPEDMHTAAWKKIVENTKSALEQELRDILLDIMREKQLSVLTYDLTALIELCEHLRLSARLKCSITRVEVREIMRAWGLVASKKTARFAYYLRESAGGIANEVTKTGKVYKISRKKLENEF